MNKKEALSSAKWAIMKGLDYETLKYSDELYGHEDDVDEVWPYVEECRAIGTIAFEKKYPEEPK